MLTRSAIAVAALAAFSAPLAAQGRPDVRAMTCGQVHALIAQRGAVVLTTGQHTYDRFVAGRRWCDHPNIPMAVRITTRDTDRCVIHNCQRDPYDDWLGNW